MKPRTAKRLAQASCGLTVSLLGASGLMSILLSIKPPSGEIPFFAIFLVLILGFASFGTLIVARHPDNSIGWLFCLVALVWALGAIPGTLAEYALSTGRTSSFVARLSIWTDSWSWMPGTYIPATFLFLLFPGGRLPSRRWRPVAWAGAAGIVGTIVSSALAPGPLQEVTRFRGPNPFGIEGAETALDILGIVSGALLLVALIGSAVAVILRLRRASGDQRQQMKWLAYTGSVVVATVITSGIVATILDAHADDLVGEILIAAILSAILLIPIASGVAILKYRLYDIDVVINKTLVYGGLVAFITAVYVAIVVGIGTLIGSRDEPSLALSIAATAVVAVAFQPVRERVRHLANRLVYGKRATPYEVMADFSHRMAGTISIEEALPEMAEAAARGVGAVRSRVRLLLPMGGEQSAVWPPDEPGREFSRAIDVYHQGQPVGEIAVAKPLGEPLTPAESKLLDDLASQAGLALHNVRLAEELRARLDEITAQSEALRLSRQRIVTARDVQRRQLEREIREGAQRQLTEIGAKLRAATDLVERDTDEAVALLDRLGADANATLAELRDLARGIFPPLLADKGVVAALEAHVRKEGIPAALNVDGAWELRFDPDIEAAVFFCCVQALQNARRHAGGVGISLRLAPADGMVEFEVSDEGTGFDLTSTGEGMGFQIMRDRVEALDGTLNVDSSPGRGTTVIGRVPGRTSEGV